MEDNQIITAILRGGENRELAYKSLFKDLRAPFTKYLRTIGGTTDDADEVLGKAFLLFERTIVRHPTIEIKSPLRTYIFAIAKYQYARQMRKKELAVFPGLDRFRFEEFEKSVEDEYLIQEKNQILDEILSKLPLRCKTLLVMFMNGFSMDEIAKLNNFSNTQVAKNEKFKCMERLKSIIENEPQYKNILKSIK